MTRDPKPNPKAEARAGLLAVAEALAMTDKPLGTNVRKMLAAEVQDALARLEQLTVARPRKA